MAGLSEMARDFDNGSTTERYLGTDEISTLRREAKGKGFRHATLNYKSRLAKSLATHSDDASFSPSWATVIGKLTHANP